MSTLNAALLHLRGQLLSAAEKCVPDVGFTNEALVRAIEATGARNEVSDGALARMFERGFPSALVEHVVRRSNHGAQQLLEAKYNKNVIVRAIARNEANFTLGRLSLPSGQNVASDALQAKIAYLRPLVAHWPDAVAIEYQPSNVPYTMIGLAEFVDTTAFYMERVDNLGRLLEPARRILNARMMASYIPSDTAEAHSGHKDSRSPTEEFLHSFVRGIPLSSGPHMGDSSFSFEWYARRAKLGVVYGTTVTSLLGDASREVVETRKLAESLVATMF